MHGHPTLVRDSFGVLSKDIQKLFAHYHVLGIQFIFAKSEMRIKELASLVTARNHEKLGDISDGEDVGNAGLVVVVHILSDWRS